MNRLRQRILGWICFACLMFGGRPVTAQTDRATPEQVHANLDRIFTQREFRPAKTSENNLVEQAVRFLREKWDWFWKQVEKLFQGRGGIAAGGAGLQWAFIVLFFVLISWILFRVFRNLRAQRQQGEAGKRTAFDYEEAEEEIPREPDVWLQQAEHFAASKEFRQAYRAVFLAILLRLDHDALVPYERSRTNGDYLRLLRARRQRALYDAMRPLTLEFDLRWYGDQETTDADYRSIRETYATVTGLCREAMAKENPAPELATAEKA